jgi:hypothetical protein
VEYSWDVGQQLGKLCAYLWTVAESVASPHDAYRPVRLHFTVDDGDRLEGSLGCMPAAWEANGLTFLEHRIRHGQRLAAIGLVELLPL